MSDALIQLKEVIKKYRTDEVETTALDGFNLSITQGEFVSVMGPSGCGKSTLLNVLGMLDRIDAGQYWFSGEEVSGYGVNALAALRKHNIGFVFQNFNLIDDLNVEENIRLPLLYQNISRSEANDRVAEVMDRLAIAHRAKHFPQQLSGGQQQRVAVGRALVAKPKVILADEPTGNLDSKNGMEVMDLLRELNASGTTIVMVTHSDHDASYSSRIVRMRDGKIHHENNAL